MPMSNPDRRAVLTGIAATAALGLAGCQNTRQPAEPQLGAAPSPAYSQYASMYAPIYGEPFPVDGVDLSLIDPVYYRTNVEYATTEEPGTIVVDPANRFLYHVEEGGRAMRYGVGVGREGFGWSGDAYVKSKQEWPDWYPPKEMIEREPRINDIVVELQSGMGVPGGTLNPLGARALYLWQGNKDTLYRIHGTFEPWTIGSNVSSGCIRLINQDIIHLYDRVALESKVVVLGAPGIA